jgi:SHS2 domain-containing protein
MADSKMNKSDAGFEEIEHTADRALRLWAPDFESLLILAARGMARILLGSTPQGPTPVRKRISLEAFDRESLLVAFLQELLYSAESDRVLFPKLEIERLTDQAIVATAHGIQVPGLATEIKAVTYHGLEIVETERGVEAVVVFDV